MVSLLVVFISILKTTPSKYMRKKSCIHPWLKSCFDYDKVERT